MSTVRSEQCGCCALLTIDNPPVNSLSLSVRQELWDAIVTADNNTAVTAIILTGDGRGFSAGGEISELHTPTLKSWPGLSNHIFPRLEQCTKPVIAAIHGFAVGGGFELALACHYRIANHAAKIGLPEIRHGVIPPSGSQRLPRAIGVERALALMVSGHTMLAEQFADTALFDRFCEGSVVEAARAFAATIEPHQPVASALLRHRGLPRAGTHAVLATWRNQLAKTPDVTDAMRACIDAIDIALNADDFDSGLVQAKRLHDALAESVSKRLNPTTLS